MSNKNTGDEFRDKVNEFLKTLGCSLSPEYKVNIGFGLLKKEHRFDLGDKETLVACKKYSWTSGGNIPSAKLATINEAVHIFCAAPKEYRKILVIWKSPKNKRRISETIAEYYIRCNGHLVPPDVEIWEFDDINMLAELKYSTNPQKGKLGGI